MPVVLARVDDRLVHGQVIEGWAPYVKADSLVVVSDAVYSEKDRCTLMQLITPDHINFEVTTIAGLDELLKKSAGSRVLLLFASLEDVLSVLEGGVRLGSINVGNLHNIKGGREVTPSVYLNSRDLETISNLVSRGIRLEAREVPDGPALDLTDIVRNREKRQ